MEALRRMLQYAVLQSDWSWPPRLNRWVASFIARVYRPYMGRVVPFVPDGRLLDVGCGSGGFLAWMEAFDVGWRLRGIDLSEVACDRARLSGLACTSGTLESHAFEPESFDVVTLWNVLEHLHDPVATIQEISRILRPGGAVSLVVPTLSSAQFQRFGDDWWVLQLPQHLVFFDPLTLSRVLTTAGLAVQEIRPRRYTYSHASIERKSRSGAGVRNMRIRIEQALDLFRSGDVLVAVATKPE